MNFMNESKNDLVACLTENEVNVTFTKADGTVRKMRCSLKPEVIPSVSGDTKHNPPKDNVICVIDLDLGQWRSFRIDRLTDFEVAP